MANKQINQLPADTSVISTDKFAIQESGGTTKNVTAEMIKTFTNTGIGASDLEAVLTAGNSTGPNDILMPSGQAIRSEDGDTITAGLEIDPLENNNGTRFYSENTELNIISQLNISEQNTTISYINNDTNESSNISASQGGIKLKTTNVIGFFTGGNNGKVFAGIPIPITTTNATETTIFTYPFPTVGIKIKDFKVNIQGFNSDNSKVYVGELRSAFKSVSTTITRVGVLDIMEKTEFTTATSTLKITGSNIVVTVTGEAATNITWNCFVELI